MIQLPVDITPDADTLNKLKVYQDEIDSLPSFSERSERAKTSFSNKNKIGNAVFDAVKLKLIEMCSGARRCVYCEDSVGDEVEHIHPKHIYPEMCFQWDNYVYACGNCNGPKNNKFAVFRKDNGQFYEVNPLKGQAAVEPPEGDDVMINPRIENPLDYCMLDLSSTFKFVVIAKSDTKDSQKADYTFNEILRLNEREFLRKARKTAYCNYTSRLGYYTSEKQKGANAAQLNEMIENLKEEAHPTVWKEMQRYHNLGILKKMDSALDNLFLESPEALGW
jgi:5-methylcytosine-specific restriction endonuclease McrA